MTTIAFDGRYLAVDSRTMRNGTIMGNDDFVKIIVRDDCVYAFTGDRALLRPVIEHAHDDGRADQWPIGSLGEDELSKQAIVKVRQHDTQASILGLATRYWLAVPAPFAMGSGGDHALTAMDCGLTAVEAMRMAIKRDAYSGGPVRYVDTSAPVLEVRTTDSADVGGWARAWGGPICWGLEPWPLSVPKPGQVRYVDGDGMAAAPSFDSITINKPAKLDHGYGNLSWRTDCAGRLVTGTGCGACKRCNREWHALVKEFAGFSNNSPYDKVRHAGTEFIVLGAEHAASVLARHPVAEPAVGNIDRLAEIACGEPLNNTATSAHYRSIARRLMIAANEVCAILAPMQQINSFPPPHRERTAEDWVNDYNDALKRNNPLAIVQLRTELGTNGFPGYAINDDVREGALTPLGWPKKAEKL